MVASMHITITGNLGSGKSTISKIIQEKYGFEIYSTGTIQRNLAKELGKSTLEMNQLMCNDPQYDNMIDDATTRTARENIHKDIIFDSRLAWNFVEKSFKVFVSVAIDEAAKRVFNDSRGDVEKYTSLEDTKNQLKARAQTENIRFKDMYDLEYFNFSNYNLIVDSSYNSSEEIAKIVMDEAKKFYDMVEDLGFEDSNKGWNKILVSPQKLLHEEISKEDEEEVKDLVKEISKDRKAICKNILVKDVDGEYHIIEGKDMVIAAKLIDLSFLEIILTK
ncbi:MAG TPA: AAA family ATPase [Clostridiales bacterium]|nr:AAA family ATPase [Clostridiales bacterium]